MHINISDLKHVVKNDENKGNISFVWATEWTAGDYDSQQIQFVVVRELDTSQLYVVRVARQKDPHFDWHYDTEFWGEFEKLPIEPIDKDRFFAYWLRQTDNFSFLKEITNSYCTNSSSETETALSKAFERFEKLFYSSD